MSDKLTSDGSFFDAIVAQATQNVRALLIQNGAELVKEKCAGISDEFALIVGEMLLETHNAGMDSGAKIGRRAGIKAGADACFTALQGALHMGAIDIEDLQSMTVDVQVDPNDPAHLLVSVTTEEPDYVVPDSRETDVSGTGILH